MANITIRNLPDVTHRALKVRAAQHGRSTEVELRIILQEAVDPIERVKLGSELPEIGRELDGVALDIERSKIPSEPASFESSSSIRM